MLDELQALVKEYREKSCADRNVSVRIPIKRCPPSTRKRAPIRRRASSDSDQEEEVPRSTRKRQPRKKIISSDSEQEDSDSQNFVEKKKGKKKQPLPDSDSDDCPRKLSALQISTSKKSRSKAQSSIIVKSEVDETPRKTVRNTRKRN